jgi:hypothetical protein
MKMKVCLLALTLLITPALAEESQPPAPSKSVRANIKTDPAVEGEVAPMATQPPASQGQLSPGQQSQVGVQLQLRPGKKKKKATATPEVKRTEP